VAAANQAVLFSYPPGEPGNITLTKARLTFISITPLSQGKNTKIHGYFCCCQACAKPLSDASHGGRCHVCNRRLACAQADLECLGEGQFLNDQIVDFYAKVGNFPPHINVSTPNPTPEALEHCTHVEEARAQK
jgi:hypothetical protein